MVQFAGKYVLEKQEHVEDYFKQLGVTEDKIKAIKENDNKTVEVTVNGSEYTISSIFGTRSFTLGKEVEEPLPNGIALKSTASLDGNKLVISSVGPDGKKSGERVYEFSDSGLQVTMSSPIATNSAKLVYKRA